MPHTCRDNVIVPRARTNVTRQMELEAAASLYSRAARLSSFGHLGRCEQGSTSTVEVPGLALMTGAPLVFFQYHHVYYEGSELQRILGWVHPRLLELLRYPGAQMFIDGTFRSVPRSFEQCAILMVRDPAGCVLVPVVYPLAGTARLQCIEECSGLWSTLLTSNFNLVRWSSTLRKT